MPDDQRARTGHEAADAEYEVVAVVDPARARVRRATLGIAAAALLVVVAIAGNLFGAGRDTAGIGPTVPPQASPPPQGTPTPSPIPFDPPIDPGPWAITFPRMRVHLTMPAGWSGEGGTAVYKPQDGEQYRDAARPNLAVHDVRSVTADLCGIRLPRGQFVEIGPGVEDLTTALATMHGLAVSGPTDVILGGYPAKRLGLDFSDRFLAVCGGPEGRTLWEDATGSQFGLLGGSNGTAYVVDVNGERLVITTTQRGATSEEVAELMTIVESIEIERAFFPDGELSLTGENSLTVDGVPFSFLVPSEGWVSGPIQKLRYGGFWHGSLLISKSTGGGQGAEAVIYWIGFPDGKYADPCLNLLFPSVGPSAADLADSVARARAAELLAGPSDVTVGGHPAKLVTLRVLADLGCNPGFFFTWPGECWGPCWMTTDVGTTIRVWIVDVNGTRLFVAGATHADAGPDLTQEIQEIVDSIEFD